MVRRRGSSANGRTGSRRGLALALALAGAGPLLVVGLGTATPARPSRRDGLFAGEMLAELRTVRHAPIRPRADCAALAISVPAYVLGCRAGERAFTRAWAAPADPRAPTARVRPGR
ncbi:MAG TPA: hypothetical protein VKV23_06835 [Acidimicrobiales bacterium]|nr:hypothetical protein [Acidimicrobiales bacterium]